MTKSTKDRIRRTERDLEVARQGAMAAEAIMATMQSLPTPQLPGSAPATAQAMLNEMWVAAVAKAEDECAEHDLGIDSLELDLAAYGAQASGYTVGDIVTKRNGTRVWVADREADVKNGEPGYEGFSIYENALGNDQSSSEVDTWGYDSDIVHVEKRS